MYSECRLASIYICQKVSTRVKNKANRHEFQIEHDSSVERQFLKLIWFNASQAPDG